MNENEMIQATEHVEGNHAQAVQDDMAKAFAEAKKNMVSKSEFEEVVRMNQQLTRQLINTNPVEVVDKPAFDLKKASQEFQNDIEKHKHMTNYEYCKRMSEIRHAAIDKGLRDPAVSTDPNSVPSEEEVIARRQVWETVEKCLAECNDDPAVFNALMRKAAPR